jgi:hypothetical protein
MLPSIRDADHRFNPFFLQRALKLLERLVVRVERIVPDHGIVVFIDDFENTIVVNSSGGFSLGRINTNWQSGVLCFYEDWCDLLRGNHGIDGYTKIMCFPASLRHLIRNQSSMSEFER